MGKDADPSRGYYSRGTGHLAIHGLSKSLVHRPLKIAHALFQVLALRGHAVSVEIHRPTCRWGNNGCRFASGEDETTGSRGIPLSAYQIRSYRAIAVPAGWPVGHPGLDRWETAAGRPVTDIVAELEIHSHQLPEWDREWAALRAKVQDEVARETAADAMERLGVAYAAWIARAREQADLYDPLVEQADGQLEGVEQE